MQECNIFTVCQPNFCLKLTYTHNDAVKMKHTICSARQYTSQHWHTHTRTHHLHLGGFFCIIADLLSLSPSTVLRCVCVRVCLFICCSLAQLCSTRPWAEHNATHTHTLKFWSAKVFKCLREMFSYSWGHLYWKPALPFGHSQLCVDVCLRNCCMRDQFYQCSTVM